MLCMQYIFLAATFVVSAALFVSPVDVSAAGELPRESSVPSFEIFFGGWGGGGDWV